MPQVSGINFQLTSGMGGLIIYAAPAYRGSSQRISLLEYDPGRGSNPVQHFQSNVVERTIDGEKTYAAVFPSLPAGNYSYYHAYTEIPFTVFAGHIAEIDVRR